MLTEASCLNGLERSAINSYCKLLPFHSQVAPGSPSLSGLAISDFFMCANFFTSTAMNLSGRELFSLENTEFCSINGFMAQLFITQSKPARNSVVQTRCHAYNHSRLLDFYHRRLHVSCSLQSQENGRSSPGTSLPPVVRTLGHFGTHSLFGPVDSRVW